MGDKKQKEKLLPPQKKTAPWITVIMGLRSVRLFLSLFTWVSS